MQTKKVTCASCDIKCSVLADVEDNKILRIRRDPIIPLRHSRFATRARRSRISSITRIASFTR